MQVIITTHHDYELKSIHILQAGLGLQIKLEERSCCKHVLKYVISVMCKLFEEPMNILVHC